MPRKILTSTLINTATINLIGNPSFERDKANASSFLWWQNYSSSGSVTKTVDGGVAKFGSKSLHLSAASAAEGGLITPAFTLSNSTKYYLSGYIKTGASVTNAAIILQQQNVWNAPIELHVTTANQDWTRVSGSFTTSSNETNPYKIFIALGGYTGGTSAGDAWFDGIQFEAATALTAYCDGDQDECKWLGMDHNSSSQRLAMPRTLIT